MDDRIMLMLLRARYHVLLAIHQHRYREQEVWIMLFMFVPDKHLVRLLQHRRCMPNSVGCGELVGHSLLEVIRLREASMRIQVLGLARVASHNTLFWGHQILIITCITV